MEKSSQGAVRPEISRLEQCPHLCACDIYGKIALLALNIFSPKEFRNISKDSPSRCKGAIRVLMQHLPENMRGEIQHMVNAVENESKRRAPKHVFAKELHYEAHRRIAMHIIKAKENNEVL